MNPFDQLDAMEASLRELAEAEQAGVFRRTRVDARSLLKAMPAVIQAPSGLRAMRWIPIAAVLAMAATICGWIFSTQTGGIRQHPLPAVTMTATAAGGCDGTFFRCLTGPSGTVASGCGIHDYNADGHVDMVDARTYQLNCNGITR